MRKQLRDINGTLWGEEYIAWILYNFKLKLTYIQPVFHGYKAQKVDLNRDEIEALRFIEGLLHQDEWPENAPDWRIYVNPVHLACIVPKFKDTILIVGQSGLRVKSSNHYLFWKSLHDSYFGHRKLNESELKLVTLKHPNLTGRIKQDE